MMRPKSKVSHVAVNGPLEPFAAGFKAELAALGYTPLSAANQLRVMAHLSRWMTAHDLGPAQLSADLAEAFLADRREAGFTCWRTMHGLSPLLKWLRDEGAVPVPVPEPLIGAEVILAEYRRYLVSERGLAKSTVRYLTAASRSLLSFLDRRDKSPHELDAELVIEHLLEERAAKNTGALKTTVTGLRSFLRYLFLDGHTTAELWSVVPTAAGWRGTALPRALSPGDVERLIKSCDRRRSMGRRDHAILLLLARLGLRAGEVAAIELDDIDWHAGEIVIRGKANRHERLPLPVEVGESIASYLQRGRPRSDSRAVFLLARAPQRPISAATITGVMARACARAGLPRAGAHQLRHSVACQVLRQGGTLEEVGQLLRQQYSGTTSIYAKVDRDALARLALAWPGTAS